MTVAAEATYEDVKDLIHWSVSKFVRQYGGDFEDLVGEANLIFAELYAGTGRAFVRQGNRSFTSALAWLISHQLRDQLRYRIYRKNRCAVTYKETTPERPDQNQRQWLTDFVDELSADAVTIVKIILETPDTVLRQELEDIREVQPKKSLMAYLKQLGWSIDRIKHSFREIEEALV